MEKHERSRNSPWLYLPQPLMDVILERLPIADYIRFGAVCRSWKAIQGDHRRGQAPSPLPTLPLPWIIYSTEGSNKRCCYSPFEDRFYRLQLPSEDDTNYIIASSHGWLVSVVDWPTDPAALFVPLTIVLLNPISGRRIQLPKLRFELRFPIVAAMSAAPTDTNSNSTIVIVNRLNIYCSQVSKPKWTRTKLRDTWLLCTALVFCAGKFYVTSYDQRFIAVVEPNIPKPTMQFLKMDVSEIPKTLHFDFLVEHNGQILMGATLSKNTYLESLFPKIRIYLESIFPKIRIYGLQVLRADLMNKVWRRVENLGDRVLILSPACSTSLPAAELGSKGNMIYFALEDECRSPWKEFDMGTMKITHVPFLHAARRYTWWWKGLNHSSLWIMPSLDSVSQTPD